MARCLRRFIFKGCLAFVLAVIAGAACCNGYLVFGRKNLIQRINAAAAPFRFECREIYFLPPFSLYVKDAVVSESGKALVFLPFARLDVSPAGFMRRQLLFSGARLYDPEADGAALIDSVKKNPRRISELFAKCRYSCGRFSIVRARLRDAVGNGPSDIDLSFRKGFFNGKGSFAIPLALYPFKEAAAVRAIAEGPIEWNLRGSFSSSSLVIEKCELKGKRFSAQFWGELEDDDVSAHGFLILDRSVRAGRMEVVAIERKHFLVRMKERADKFILRRLFPAAVRPPQEGMRWNDIRPGRDIDVVEMDCRLGLCLPRIELKRIHLMLNKMPLNFRGSLSLAPVFSFEADVTSSMLSRETDLPYSFHGLLTGSASEKGISTTGELEFGFRPSRDPAAWKEVRIRFQDLICSLRSPSCLSLKASRFWLMVLQNEERRSLRLDNPKATVFLGEGRYKSLSACAELAGGKAKGSCRIDVGSVPSRLKAYVWLYGAEAGRLGGLTDYFNRLSGKLDGTLRFTFPSGGLTGTLRMTDGSLKDFDFFVWLEEFLGVPGLRAIDFRKLRTGFWVGKEGAGLTSLDLASPEISVNGDYGHRDGRVNGRLSLSLSRSLLEKAPKFRPLLALVDKKQSSLNFSFRLSGRPDAMNFLWLQSDFKRELQKAIPGFIERRIERNVEKMITSIAQE